MIKNFTFNLLLPPVYEVRREYIFSSFVSPKGEGVPRSCHGSSGEGFGWGDNGVGDGSPVLARGRGGTPARQDRGTLSPCCTGQHNPPLPYSLSQDMGTPCHPLPLPLFLRQAWSVNKDRTVQNNRVINVDTTVA